jgi:hypothetical protein
MRPSDRVEFFLKHAVFSYRYSATDAEKEAAKLANAEALVRAELAAESLGWTVELEDEVESWDGDCDPPRYCFCVCIKDANGKCLDSLGMVGVDSLDDPYLQVIAAEMFLESINAQATANVALPAISAACALAHANLIVKTISEQDVQVPFTREQMKQIAIRAENIARWARRKME